MITNLLENCLRYTEADGTIWLSCYPLDNYGYISIEDSGPGVNVTALDKLFERLYREDSSRNSQTGGSGLGLAICKNIVNAHGGDINATNNQHGGLTITIRLPKVI
ncbi:sensor histidine kinase [Colwellia sp. MEBiC06753]